MFHLSFHVPTTLKSTPLVLDLSLAPPSSLPAPSLLRILIPEQIHTQIIIAHRKDPDRSSPQARNLPAQIARAILLPHTYAQARADCCDHHRVADHDRVITVCANVVAGVDRAVFGLFGLFGCSAFRLVVVLGRVVVDVRCFIRGLMAELLGSIASFRSAFASFFGELRRFLRGPFGVVGGFVLGFAGVFRGFVLSFAGVVGGFIFGFTGLF